MELESGLLKTVLEVAILNGLPMIVVYWIMNIPLLSKVLIGLDDWLYENLGFDVYVLKRYTAIILSAFLSVGLYAIYAAVGFTDMPSGFVEWIDVVLAIGGINFTGTQVLHALERMQTNRDRDD